MAQLETVPQLDQPGMVRLQVMVTDEAALRINVASAVQGVPKGEIISKLAMTLPAVPGEARAPIE